ncbi:type 1 glutamine amidotransferase [Streptacidiphilus rugosus]|uniref:type 1 glutamine amidotransferase n=1 Tax=Streptacidiphilus rugosus TaxID=405783 RepID=UPI0006906CCD|nr:type 1 glutamine amidotransferase [Streptacidiphilus rugosus]
MTDTILVVQHEDGTGPGLVGAALAADGFGLDLRHAWAGEALPASLAAHAGLLVLGGAPNCEDDVAAPWLPAVRTLVREAVADEVPLLGICLGGQIVAAALGGKVAPRTAAPEVGAVPLRRLPGAWGDPLFDAVPEGARAAQWHWDDIVALPAGGVPLLTGDDCLHQAFRLGRAAWGVQFHPEVLSAQVSDWSLSDGPAVRAAGGDPDAAVTTVRAAEAQLRTVWSAMAHAWGRVVTTRG